MFQFGPRPAIRLLSVGPAVLSNVDFVCLYLLLFPLQNKSADMLTSLPVMFRSLLLTSFRVNDRYAGVINVKTHEVFTDYYSAVIGLSCRIQQLFMGRKWNTLRGKAG